MSEVFDLEQYLTGGVEEIVRDAIKATLSNPKESLFMARFARASQKAAKLRRDAETRGEHIPPFLISSITSRCNLHCAGCYARANNTCHDEAVRNQLSDREWERIFLEARALGISFILLAGGEPLIRQDVIKKAGQIPDILFPVFTNGTMIQKEYLSIFDQHRNLVPVLSIEGDKDRTDQRRGDGIYAVLQKSMIELKENNLIYGASITVTKENKEEVTNREFLDSLYTNGCKLVFYVEYVPMEQGQEMLAPDDKDREYMDKAVENLRKTYDGMLFISFPGDEKTSGGCLAAGRGFFHINPTGGAEPCPFSPYSDTSLRDCSLKEALQSPLFLRLREDDILLTDHLGGCVLYNQRELVEELLGNSEKNRMDA